MNGRLEAAIHAVDRATTGIAMPAQAIAAAKVKGLMVGYDARWSDAEWELDGEPERVVRLPIVNPETGRTSRTFTQAGKFDGVVSGYGKRVLLEHKSTSDDVTDPNAVYWRRLAIDSQVSKYVLQAWQSGEHLDGTLYDVVRKPTIRPKQLTKDALAEITMRGQYCGMAVPAPAIDAVAAGLREESPELYCLRLARETMADPERYYQRRMIPRLDDEVLEYATELWTIADEIRLARLSGRHFRNSAACLEYGRPCEYLGLCSGHDEPTSDNWRRAEEVHEELPPVGIEGGRDVITHSRTRCFQTCRRKHHLRYNLGLRRVHEDEPEALYLGTLLHVALAAWWSHPKGEAHGHTIAGSAVNEIAESATAG